MTSTWQSQNSNPGFLTLRSNACCLVLCMKSQPNKQNLKVTMGHLAGKACSAEEREEEFEMRFGFKKLKFVAKLSCSSGSSY